MADRETAEGFSEKIQTMLINGFTCMGINAGQRLGLFEVLSKFNEPKTSQEIADAKGYKERYVREWLGIMVTAGIIDIDQDGRRYVLPKHRIATLTDPAEIAVHCPIIPMFCKVEEELYNCFQLDGPTGIPYSSYPDFQAYGKRVTSFGTKWSALEKHLSLVPGILGELEKGIEFCDVGTGAGLLPLNIAEKFPRSTIWGLDISEEGINMARKDAETRGLKNVRFEVQDISNMPADWTNKWDLLYMNDIAHDVPHASKAFKEVHRVLKPGGHLIIIDEDLHTEQKDNIGNPFAPLTYTWSLFHCMPVSLAVEGGEGLGAAWGMEKGMEMLKKAGFAEVKLSPEGFQMVCTKAE